MISGAGEHPFTVSADQCIHTPQRLEKQNASRDTKSGGSGICTRGESEEESEEKLKER
jgi:hypothetical protein